VDQVLTGVMEGDQQVGAAGLPAGVCTSLDDGEGPQSRGGDLLKHAASGVDDKHQRRGLLHAEQPGQTRCTGQRCWREGQDSGGRGQHACTFFLCACGATRLLQSAPCGRHSEDMKNFS